MRFESDAQLNNLPPLPPPKKSNKTNTSMAEPLPAMEEPVSSLNETPFNHFRRFQAKFCPQDAFLFSMFCCFRDEVKGIVPLEDVE